MNHSRQNPDGMLVAPNAAEVSGRKAIAFEGNVADEQAWRELIDIAISEFGKIDILFNNAGIGGSFASPFDYPEADFDQVMAVNVRGVFLGIKYIGGAMKQHGGSIVNTSSISGFGGGGTIIGYVASKHAVNGMTKTAAISFAPYNIRVNAVCPSPTATDMRSGPNSCNKFRFAQNLTRLPLYNRVYRFPVRLDVSMV